MTKNRFEKEMRYQVMLSICRSMTAQGVLSKNDAVWTERFLREKISAHLRDTYLI